MGNPVVHFEIGGSNLKALEGFYTQLFDWQLHSVDGPEYSLVQTGGEGTISGGLSGTSPGAPPAWVTFYVQVDDIDAYLSKAEQLGGKTLLPAMPVPGGGSIAWFSDPSGNCIGLYRIGAA